MPTHTQMESMGATMATRLDTMETNIGSQIAKMNETLVSVASNITTTSEDTWCWKLGIMVTGFVAGILVVVVLSYPQSEFVS